MDQCFTPDAAQLMPSRTQAMPHLQWPLTQSFPRTAVHATDAAKSTVEEALMVMAGL
jgi:hypothetical protein